EARRVPAAALDMGRRRRRDPPDPRDARRRRAANAAPSAWTRAAVRMGRPAPWPRIGSQRAVLLDHARPPVGGILRLDRMGSRRRPAIRAGLIAAAAAL